jgi:hypothetical protein
MNVNHQFDARFVTTYSLFPFSLSLSQPPIRTKGSYGSKVQKSGKRRTAKGCVNTQTLYITDFMTAAEDIASFTFNIPKPEFNVHNF